MESSKQIMQHILSKFEIPKDVMTVENWMDIAKFMVDQAKPPRDKVSKALLRENKDWVELTDRNDKVTKLTIQRGGRYYSFEKDSTILVS